MRSQKFYFDVPMITKYRKHDYQGGQNQNQYFAEEHVWKVYNLDQEYGKFKSLFMQTRDFMFNLIEAIPDVDE
jgi:hypothetical protein